MLNTNVAEMQNNFDPTTFSDERALELFQWIWDYSKEWDYIGTDDIDISSRLLALMSDAEIFGLNEQYAKSFKATWDFLNARGKLGFALPYEFRFLRRMMLIVDIDISADREYIENFKPSSNVEILVKNHRVICDRQDALQEFKQLRVILSVISCGSNVTRPLSKFQMRTGFEALQAATAGDIVEAYSLTWEFLHNKGQYSHDLSLSEYTYLCSIVHSVGLDISLRKSQLETV